MVTQSSKPQSRVKARKTTVFVYWAPQAQSIGLAGSFNNWDPSKTPLEYAGEGKWTAEVQLPAGRYEYRFWVDGIWQNDQRPVECVPNAFGSWNCVIEVK